MLVVLRIEAHCLVGISDYVTWIVVYTSRCPVSTTKKVVTEPSYFVVIRSHGAYRPVDLILEPRDGFLLAIAVGEVSFDSALEGCRNMVDLAAGLGLRKILLDCLAVEGDLSRREIRTRKDYRGVLPKQIASPRYCPRR